jgi:hypothetical protein
MRPDHDFGKICNRPHADVSDCRDMFQFRHPGAMDGRMVLALSIPERLTRARSDLRMGVPVVLCGAEGPRLSRRSRRWIRRGWPICAAWRAGAGDHRAAGDDAEGAGL